MIGGMNCPRCGHLKAELTRLGKPYLICRACAAAAQRHKMTTRVPRAAGPCRHCGQPKTEFQGPKRLQRVCRPCATSKTRAWHAAHPDSQTVRYRADPERAASNRREWRAKNRTRDLLAHRQYEASNRGIPFTITSEDVGEPTACGCCAVTLVWKGGRTSPSLDKKIPSLGYVPGNVAWLCHRCNRIKNDGAREDFEKILCYLAK